MCMNLHNTNPVKYDIVFMKKKVSPLLFVTEYKKLAVQCSTSVVMSVTLCQALTMTSMEDAQTRMNNVLNVGYVVIEEDKNHTKCHIAW